MKIELPPHLDDGPGGKPSGTIEGGGVVVRCSSIGPHVEHFEVAVFLNDITDSNRERLEEFVRAQIG